MLGLGNLGTRFRARFRTRCRPRHAEASLLAAPRWAFAASVAVVMVVVAAVAGSAVLGDPTAARAAMVAGAADLPPHGAASRTASLGVAGSFGVAGSVDIAGHVVRLGPGSAAALATRAGSAATVPTAVSVAADGTAASALARSGIPVTALQAYRRAAAREQRLDPACHLAWPLLAGIGRVESDHGRFAGAVLHADGLSTPPIIGIALNGHGTALIRDTDHGRLDGDTVYDHAVGPMQFIPSTWASWGVDADGDGVANPFDIFDAAAAAADYLCAAGVDLGTYAGQLRAIRSYNDSDAYIALVMAVERVYAAGAGVVVPVAPGPGSSGPSSGPPLPPVNPGPPPAVHRHRHHHRRHGRHHRGGTHTPSPSPTTSSHSPPPSSSTGPSPSSSAPSGSPSSSSSGSSSPSASPSSSSSCPSPPGSSGASSTPASTAAPSAASSSPSVPASSSHPPC